MFSYKKRTGWTTFEEDLNKYDSDEKLQYKLLALSKEIFENLIEKKYFREPCVYIKTSNSELCADLKERANECKCQTTDDPEEATHIIYDKISHSQESYARPLFKQGENIMMHWCFLPGSYDSFIPNTLDLSVSI